MQKRVIPPLYFFILLLLVIQLHSIFPIVQIFYFPYNLIGILLIIFGGLINLWAALLFFKKDTTILPDNQPSCFIASGPFCFTRNPIYLGMAAALLGAAIFLGSLITFISPLIFVLLIQTLVIPIEEKNLEAKFGKQYLDYKKRVRRWI